MSEKGKIPKSRIYFAIVLWVAGGALILYPDPSNNVAWIVVIAMGLIVLIPSLYLLDRKPKE